MLQENTSLQSLNIESNFITAEGMKAVVKAMASNATLVELKIDNQVEHKYRFTFIHIQLIHSMIMSLFDFTLLYLKGTVHINKHEHQSST
jgi:hypothetical protein